MGKKDRLGILHWEHPALSRQREIATLPTGPVPDTYAVPRERVRPPKPLEGQMTFDISQPAMTETDVRSHE